MAKAPQGKLIARDVAALDVAATKARSRTFYQQRKSNPRLQGAIEVANAVHQVMTNARAMDYLPGRPSGHPNPVNVVPIGDRTPGFSRPPHTINLVGSELPNPGAPVRHNDVTAAIQALDAVTPQLAKVDAALARLAADVRDGRKTLDNAQAELKRLFPGLDSDTTDLGHFMANGQASDAGLTINQILDTL